MKQRYAILLALLLAAITFPLAAQNLLITTTNTDNLYVCGEDDLSVKLQNTGTGAVNNIIVTVSLPAGINYVPASVSGATQINITDLMNPQFTVANLGNGAQATFTIKVKADCDAVSQINTGQLFSNTIKATYSGGSDQINSANYTVETGLVVIESATPFKVAGEKGDMLIRQIVVKNTRLGPISNLQLWDIHFPGYTAEALGAATQSNSSTVRFDASYNSANFNSIGDGDGLFEFNESITIVEKVTITSCGTPPYISPSTIRVGWGCDGNICQYDSVNTEVEILTSTQNPDIRFETRYGYPISYCGERPAESEVLIINSGNLAATDGIFDFRILVTPTVDYTPFAGFTPGSFEYNNGSGWQSIQPTIEESNVLEACGLEALRRAVVTIPNIPANDTTVIRFKTTSCSFECMPVDAPFDVITFYKKACPEDASGTDRLLMRSDSNFNFMRAYVKFDIDTCLKIGERHNMLYIARSPRFLVDTGYIQFRLALPRGIYWDETCGIPKIEGKNPVYTLFDIDPEDKSEIILAYKLPFNADSVVMPFCLKYLCKPDMECTDGSGTWDPNGTITTIWQGGCEDGCGLKVNAQASLNYTPDGPLLCGYMSCSPFFLFVDVEECPQGGGGGGGGIFVGGEGIYDYTTYRINYGLKDNDDNRSADSNAKPDLSKIRLDRYIPGDTLRLDFRAVATSGSITGMSFRVFTESILSDAQDFGTDEFAMFPFGLGLVNNLSLTFLRGDFKIKKANGQIINCPSNYSSFGHQRYADVQMTNVAPPQTIDQLLTMFRQFDWNIADCSPGTTIVPGDSIFFTYDYAFDINLTPPSGATPPPLIAVRNTIGEIDEEYAYDHYDPYGPVSQYSGFVEGVGFPRHTVQGCDTSTQQTPFRYRIRIARDNMFPFEVRELSTVPWLDWEVPAAVRGEVNLNSAVTTLELQQSVPVATNLPTAWTTTPNGYYFDFESQLFTQPIDEGFQMVTNLAFDPTCDFFGPDSTYTRFGIQYIEQFPDTASLAIVKRRNPTGLFDALPIFKPLLGNTNLDLTKPTFTFDFGLQNTRPAFGPNTWMYIEPLNGSLDGVKLYKMPENTLYPSVGNLFQIGDVNPLETNLFRLEAINNNCAGLDMRLILGWNCDPVTSPESESCGRDTILFNLSLEQAVLELNVINQPESVPLCEPSDYFTFEISNAEKGNAFGVRPSVKLPPGLTIVSGSVQIQYPSPGGSWTNINDGTLLPGNIYEWKFNEILPTLVDGLPNFFTQPENAFKIRFRTIAECNFVANAQPVYGVDGIQPCGISTNSLRKPDDPIGLDGVEPSYGVSISLSPSSNNGLSCGEELEIVTQVLLEGTPANGDSIYLTLPLGLSYVAGSYANVQNAPTGAPLIQGQTIQLAYSPGLTAGSVMKFKFKIKYDAAAGCVDKFITAQARQKTVGFCVLTNQNCSVYIATGETLLAVPSQNADLKLTSFNPVSNGNGFNFTATLQNFGQSAVGGAVIQLVQDLNGNGQPDANEPVVQTVNYNQSIAAGGSANLNGSLNLPLEQLCKLIAVLPAEPNCACAPKVLPLENFNTPLAVVPLCDVSPISFGIDPIAGHSYSWQPSGLLSCQNCPNPTFTPGSNVQIGDIYDFILTETAGECSIEHPFQVRFGGELGITTPDQQVCRGDTVRLDATPGGTYSWTGPGVNATAQTQFLVPTSNSVYNVTVTFPQGCTGTDEVAVTIVEPTNINLGVLQTCPGVPVTLFDGDTTSVAGVYCKTYQKLNGCDSTICQTVQVFGASGASTAGFCPGDSVLVFDEFIRVAGNYCKTFTTAGGCDSTHCVTVSAYAGVSLGIQDSTVIVKGSSVQLNGPAGYATYAWSPAAGLSCTDCQSPTASPDTTTNYRLFVTNGNGCSDDVIYRVVVFPPCFESIRVPNAFTPNGDNVNDVFQVVKTEGAGFEKIVGLQVYNRWGQKIYASTTNPTWDGKVDGADAPVDVYIIIFDVECNGEIKRLPERELSLIR